jgi:hypothetical protein
MTASGLTADKNPIEIGSVQWGRYQKKQLENRPAIHEVPGITEMQRIKINALIFSGKSGSLDWLSPRQRQALSKAE